MEEIFSCTVLAVFSENLHTASTKPKANGLTRCGEIENWIDVHGLPDQPMLVLDDHASGVSLRHCA